MYMHTEKILPDFKLAVESHTAKFNSLPKFPAIRYYSTLNKHGVFTELVLYLQESVA